MKNQLTLKESAKLIELGVSPKRASESESSVAYGNIITPSFMCIGWLMEQLASGIAA